MKLTESINICYISVRNTCTTKANMKETFMGNDGSANVYVVNGLQSVTNLVFGEGGMDSCYSVLTLGNP